MNIQTVAEHILDFDLLPKKANILDAGCRGMEFTNEMRRLGHMVIAIDLDDLHRGDYFQIALGKEVGRVGINRSSDPQATTMCEGQDVMCMTIDMLCKTTQVNFFDLIKLDIEGSEYDVIMSMDKPYAKQMSIEFHRHTGVYGDGQIDEMVVRLESLGYETVSHEKTSQHGLLPNFWSSLFVLK